MADEPVAVANTLASPLGPDRVGQVGENFRVSEILLFEAFMYTSSIKRKSKGRER